MKKPTSPIIPLLFCASVLPSQAEDFTSTGNGRWHSTHPDGMIWNPEGNPQPGSGDNLIINGHQIIFANSIDGATAGLPGSNDLGVSNGNRIDINNGGVLSQEQTGWWTRIGHNGLGTLNINEGRFHFSNGTGGGSNLQVGVQNAGSEGRINIGDGTGGAGTAILNLRDRIDGSSQGGNNSMNLGASNNTFGTVIINSDGLLEGGAIIRNGEGAITANPHIRVGQSSSDTQSLLRINAGGQANVRGNLEVGAGGGARGLLHLNSGNSRMDQYDGEFTIGFNGTGVMHIETGATYQRHTGNGNMSMFVGRSNGNGTLHVDGGSFLNDTGASLFIANGGTSSVGTFRQDSGTTQLGGSVIMAQDSGTANFDLRGGTVTVNSAFFMGGANTGSAGNGTATGTQSGGTLTVGGVFVVGLAANHSASYSLTGGIINHNASDLSVGESGSGTLYIGAGATFNDASAAINSGRLFVGRNNGSSGVLTVDGRLVKTHATEHIRVGNGNADGVDNTDATGLLQGTGEIEAAGVRIGALGTITGGTNTTVGHLTITGNLNFSAGGTLLANFDSGSVDRLSVNGTVDISDATLDGDWLGDGPVGIDSRYWLILNDGDDSIVGTFANAVDTSASAGLYPDADGFITLDGQEFAIFYGADYDTNSFTGGNDVLLSAIPEPSTAALLLLAGLAGTTRRRR